MRPIEDISGGPSVRLLLVCDLDGTLIPPAGAGCEGDLERFTTLVEHRSRMLLAYATGRHYALAIEGVNGHNLPMPDALICDVGTSVYYRTGKSLFFRADSEYAAQLESEFGADMNERICGLIRGLPGVWPQEESKQGRFKVSFYAESDLPEEAVLTRVRSRLGPQSDALKLIFSIDPLDGKGLLDVLPRGISKGSATLYLHGRLGVSRDRVLYAGDSGNDADALLAGFNAVLVGNAPDSLRESLRERASRQDSGGRLYLADSSYAAGVVEACHHFGFD